MFIFESINGVPVRQAFFDPGPGFVRGTGLRVSLWFCGIN
jgi:hypothetical protein